MKLTTLSANEILSHVKDQVKNMFLDRPPNMTDMELDEEEDCAFLQKYLEEHYANVPTKWGMITGTIGYCLNSLKTMTVAVWNKLDPIGHIWMFFAWCIKSGISIWKMIIENPKTAYWTLCAVKIGKTRMCGAIGDIMKSLGCSPTESAIFKWMERQFPGKKFTAQSMMSIFLNDMLKPRLQEYLIDFSSRAVKETSKVLKGFILSSSTLTSVTSTAGAALAPLTGGISMVIGPLIGGVLTAVCDTAIAGSEEDAERVKYMI